MRLIAIGDIHGHREKLERLIKIIQPIESDRLVFLGDYIDRGPDSAGVIDCLLQLAARYPPTVFLRGNHEQLFLDALVSEAPDRLPGWQRLADQDLHYANLGSLHSVLGPNAHLSGTRTDLGVWLRNGGGQMLMSYGVDADRIINPEERIIPWEVIPQEHVDFLSRTKLWHRQDGFLFVHAGAKEEPLENQRYTLLWDRYCPPGNTEIHVVGHDPVPDGRPHFEPGRYSLDTGAASWGALTACNVFTREFWQA